MTQQIIDLGDTPDDGSGDPLRVSFRKINSNFTELYSTVGNIISGNSASWPVSSVAGKTGDVILGVSDIYGAVSPFQVTSQIELAINTAFNNVQSGSPVVLAILNEVANAFANDPNFTTDLMARIDSKLPLTGGTLTGPLVLNGTPTSDLEAVPKQYVTAINDVIQLQFSNTFPISGGTLTGSLILQSDPTLPLEATTKQYVDGNVTLLEQNLIANVNALSSNIALKVDSASIYTKAEIDQLLINIGKDNDWGLLGPENLGLITEPVTITEDFGAI